MSAYHQLPTHKAAAKKAINKKIAIGFPPPATAKNNDAAPMPKIDKITLMTISPMIDHTISITNVMLVGKLAKDSKNGLR